MQGRQVSENKNTLNESEMEVLMGLFVVQLMDVAVQIVQVPVGDHREALAGYHFC